MLHRFKSGVSRAGWRSLFACSQSSSASSPLDGRRKRQSPALDSSGAWLTGAITVILAALASPRTFPRPSMRRRRPHRHDRRHAVRKALRRDHAPVPANLIQYAVGAVFTLPSHLATEGMRPTGRPSFGRPRLPGDRQLVDLDHPPLAMIRAEKSPVVSALFYLVPPLSALFAGRCWEKPCRPWHGPDGAGRGSGSPSRDGRLLVRLRLSSRRAARSDEVIDERFRRAAPEAPASPPDPHRPQGPLPTTPSSETPKAPPGWNGSARPTGCAGGRAQGLTG